MEISDIILHIEALIFASDKPLTTPEITELINNAFGFMDNKIIQEQVNTAIEEIVGKYDDQYPFEIFQSGGGWQFLTRKHYHKTVAHLNGEKFFKRLSAASLETMSIIAYKQPITKGEIESIRGVNSDYSIQKLLEKELIVITGRNEELPGKPLVYATSRNFMDYFGINSADELPRIREILSNQAAEATFVNESNNEKKDAMATSGGKTYDSGNIGTESKTGNTEEETQPENAPVETGANDEFIEANEDFSLVVRGNGELIEETFVVDTDTESIEPEVMIDPENIVDDELGLNGNAETKTSGN